MSRQVIKFSTLALFVVWAAAGCHPQQPFYFFEDGDLSHYMDVAIEREEPDVCQPPIDEVVGAREPLTLDNADKFEIWELSLEECVQHTLNNSQVMRGLGGRVSGRGPLNLANFQGFGPQNVVTTFDPAIIESGTGFNTGSPLSVNGVESALSAFDAQWNSSIVWEKNDRPQNFRNDQVFPPVFDQDTARFTSGITKTNATGGTVAFRNNTVYDQNNSPLRALISDYTTNFEAEVRQPLLQGAGTQFNRIAGPSQGGLQNIDGVMIARIRVDMTLADFETGVRNLLEETETAYYELYFAYRNLDARKIGRDSALQAWKKVNNLKITGSPGGEAEKEAQARAQYFLFRSEVENALTGVYTAEGRLRYLMGLATSDGRLIRPSDEPSNARMSFDWCSIHPEALARRCELRKQKWEVKKRELELIAARNFLLPRLDATARYRWLGLGDDLISSNTSGLQPLQPGSNAFESLMDGGFQEWQMGLNLNIPIGFRRELTTVRHHQLLLARERAVLRDMELEVSHQLGEAIRSLVNNYNLTQTNFNRRVAAEREVEAVGAAYETGKTTLDLLLDAQRRRADAEVAYYRSLTDYNLAIMQVHRSKDSLLEYNGVYLAEGPWPKKAYFDALREARKRDASMYLDYGFTRPRVVSGGPVGDQGGSGMHEGDVYHEEGGMYEQQMPTEAEPEEIPAPSLEPTPAEPLRSAGKELKISEPSGGPLLQSPQLTTTRSTTPRETASQTRATSAAPALRSQPTSLKLSQPGSKLSQPRNISSETSAAAEPAKKSNVVRLNFEEFSKKSPNAP